MHTRQGVAVHPPIQSNVLTPSFGSLNTDLPPSLHISSESISRQGEYEGPTLGGASGNLSLAAGLGDVWIVGDVVCSGNLSVGGGTTLHVSGKVLVGNTIRGKGSLIAGQQTEAHAILLGGDLRSRLSIESRCVINVGGSVVCEDSVEGATGIIVAGDLKAAANVESKLGDIRVGGRVDIGVAMHAVNVKVGGDLQCWWLTVTGSVVAGGSITAKEDIRANLSISAKGRISVGWRIFAGLIEARRARRAEQLIQCAEIGSGSVACGELVLLSA